MSFPCTCTATATVSITATITATATAIQGHTLGHGGTYAIVSIMFEHRHEPLISRAEFARRMFRTGVVGALIVAGSLGIGTIGYRETEGLAWIDAVLNAAMILTGMGPVSALHTTTGKLFGVFYALFSGVVFLSVVAILISPVAHRVLHRFHLGAESAGAD